mmetsp:Transcript_8675/g.20446  ORF Transcript_8675/g.20446 Transcript_8675/m.20446 type:complete len:247 (+) Transcript_8675:21-761(+)
MSGGGGIWSRRRRTVRRNDGRNNGSHGIDAAPGAGRGPCPPQAHPGPNRQVSLRQALLRRLLPRRPSDEAALPQPHLGRHVRGHGVRRAGREAGAGAAGGAGGLGGERCRPLPATFGAALHPSRVASVPQASAGPVQHPVRRGGPDESAASRGRARATTAAATTTAKARFAVTSTAQTLGVCWVRWHSGRHFGQRHRLGLGTDAAHLRPPGRGGHPSGVIGRTFDRTWKDHAPALAGGANTHPELR